LVIHIFQISTELTTPLYSIDIFVTISLARDVFYYSEDTYMMMMMMMFAHSQTKISTTFIPPTSSLTVDSIFIDYL